MYPIKIQNKIINRAKNQLSFLIFSGWVFNSFLASDSTISGINLMEILINIGTIIKSSSIPKTGIKSGIKSMGLNKYPTVKPIKSFAIRGVLLSEYAILKI